MEKVIFCSNKSGYTKVLSVQWPVGVHIVWGAACRRVVKIDFFLPLVVLCGRIKYWKMWPSTFFQHDDLKLSTKSCVGSVPCVTLLFLEVFGPEKEIVK